MVCLASGPRGGVVADGHTSQSFGRVTRRKNVNAVPQAYDTGFSVTPGSQKITTKGFQISSSAQCLLCAALSLWWTLTHLSRLIVVEDTSR